VSGKKLNTYLLNAGSGPGWLKSYFSSSVEMEKPLHAEQEKKGAQLPQSPSGDSRPVVLLILFSGQLSKEQQGIRERVNM
jgi:hypothetical protein